jgi:hypothetical protein
VLARRSRQRVGRIDLRWAFRHSYLGSDTGRMCGGGIDRIRVRVSHSGKGYRSENYSSEWNATPSNMPTHKTHDITSLSFHLRPGSNSAAGRHRVTFVGSRAKNESGKNLLPLICGVRFTTNARTWSFGRWLFAKCVRLRLADQPDVPT